MEPTVVSEDLVENAFTNLKNHPSIKLISNTFNNAGASFSFQYVSLDETSKEMEKLNPKKAIQPTDIPNEVNKKNIDLTSFYVHHNFNDLLLNSLLPTPLKYADVKGYQSE